MPETVVHPQNMPRAERDEFIDPLLHNQQTADLREILGKPYPADTDHIQEALPINIPDSLINRAHAAVKN